ncbi:MAG: hypothetical protein ABIJ48_08550 [Actinomycetota bacterium]
MIAVAAARRGVIGVGFDRLRLGDWVRRLGWCLAVVLVVGACGDDSVFRDATTSAGSSTNSSTAPDPDWSPPSAALVPRITVERLQALEAAIELPAVEETDNDGNGVIDRFVQQYSERQVAEGVTLSRRLRYVRQADGSYAGTLMLEFEVGGDQAISYRHVVQVDKSFAPTIDDLVFSVPPTEVIDPDPVWAHEVEYTPGRPAASGTALEVRVDSGVPKTSPEEVQAAAEDMALIEAMEACDRMEGEEQMLCRLLLFVNHSDSPLLQEAMQDYNLAELGGAVMKGTAEADAGYCNVLPDEDRDLCRYYLTRTFIRACEQRFDPDEEVYRECVRLAVSDIWDPMLRFAACGHVADAAMRDECLGKGSVEVCDRYPEGAPRARCILAYATAAGDPALCERIPPDLRPFNLDFCLKYVSLVADDPDGCMRISDESQRAECLSLLAAERRDADLCERLESREHRERCYATVGAATGDVAACLRAGARPDPDRSWEEDPQTSWERDVCIVTAIKHANLTDHRWCDEILDLDGQHMRETCLTRVALNARNTYVCTFLTAAPARDSCFALVAQAVGDLALCDLIDDGEVEQQCRHAVCRATTDPDVRERCRELFGEAGTTSTCTITTATSSVSSLCANQPDWWIASHEEWVEFCWNSRCSSIQTRTPECDER